MFSIGELSRRTEVKVPTIRYYEQMGILSASDRTVGNQRRYSRDELERLAFIKHSRDLGLSISSIRDLIRLNAHPDEPCSDADHIARAHLVAVRNRIDRLKRLETELERIVSACNGGSIADCNVIKSLSDHTLCSDEH